MKRLFAFLLIAACLTAALPAGAASFAASRAAIKYAGSTYRIGQTGTGWKSKLGSYTRKMNNSDGALFSFTYTFKALGVKVRTLYSATLNKEKIVAVLVTGKSVSTAAGLKVGHGYAKMSALYGTKYKKSGKVYTYSAGGRKLQIKASNGRVAAFKIS